MSKDVPRIATQVFSPDGWGDFCTYRFRQVGSNLVLSYGSMDPDNPTNWPKRRKFLVVSMGILTVINSTLSSSLPSCAVAYIAKDFRIESKEQLALPISMFLIGYACGPLLCGPLSESFGRKPVMVTAFVSFMALTFGCAACQNWETLLILRLFVGITASAPMSIVGGLMADIYSDPRTRGTAMTYCMAATTVGLVSGPAISGFVSPIGWRWSFWIGLIISALILPIILLSPETFEPVLLKQKARQLQEQTGNYNIISPMELEKRDLKQIITIALARPIRMFVRESIVLFNSLYLALVFALFFLYFQTYPIIFHGIYDLSSGTVGLTYIPIVIGGMSSLPICLWWDSYLYKAKARGAAWSQIEEYRRLPLACLGGPLYVVSLFWLGWTSSSHIHWVVPMMSGILFGAGFVLILIAVLNYLGDAYETLSASAQSASSCSRSLLGAALPIAASPMFTKLGAPWACTLLAIISLVTTAIPFIFIKYGKHIRTHSKFCQYLKRIKEQRLLEEDEGTTVASLASLSSLSLASSTVVDDEDWGVPLKAPPQLPQFWFEMKSRDHSDDDMYKWMW